MYHVMILGAGKIGALIALLLAAEKDYTVTVVDPTLDSADFQRVRHSVFGERLQLEKAEVADHDRMVEIIKQYQISTVISCLPFHLNKTAASLARECDLHYFDLTEDRDVTAFVKDLANGAETAFVPQCGLAPGFISIAASSLMQEFESVETVKLRVGALPQHSQNALHYALTWSTEGLINEYCHPCQAIVNGELTTTAPLSDKEQLQLEGECYEAFNTAGGLGSLAELSVGKVQEMNYKTIRYLGHCDIMRVLLHDLKLAENRTLLKDILEHAIPKTYQDKVLVYVSVTGQHHHSYLEKSIKRTIMPATIHGLPWSAIQVATASGIAAVVDIVLQNPRSYKGLVLQENIAYRDFSSNRFAQHYKEL